MLYGRRIDFRALAQKAGGYAALARDPAPHLSHAGLPSRKVEAWMGLGAGSTRGTPLTLADSRYPERLRRTPLPPPVLCVEGDLEALRGPAVSIVGTRRCSDYGASIAYTLAAKLAAAGVTVVSGLAWGIDAAAHRGALSRGRTLAVLGHGLGHIAPSRHARLRSQIIERGGLMVSVWPDAVPPRPGNFPQRNQWISGLSDRVVVVEMPMKSGARHTANSAAEQGRDVFAVPGQMGVSTSAGCLDLIEQGAHVVRDIDQFVEAYAATSRVRDDWLGWIAQGQTVEEVARVSRRPVAELLADLSVLEAYGRVVRLAGQRYAVVPTGDAERAPVTPPAPLGGPPGGGS